MASSVVKGLTTKTGTNFCYCMTRDTLQNHCMVHASTVLDKLHACCVRWQWLDQLAGGIVVHLSNIRAACFPLIFYVFTLIVSREVVKIVWFFIVHFFRICTGFCAVWNCWRVLFGTSNRRGASRGTYVEFSDCCSSVVCENVCTLSPSHKAVCLWVISL